MSGRLVSENGLNVSGAKVLAYLDSVDIGDGLTDGNGSYAIQAMIPYDSTSGNHSIYAVYMPAGGSLSGSYSDKDAVRVNAIHQVMAINGTPLVLFSNDTLNVTGSLHTDSGAPVASQFVTVRVSDTISGTVTTDQSGDFSFSRTVNGFDPAGFYDVSVSLPSSVDVEPADAGHVLILPVDKAIAITFFAAILVILFVLVLLANAGMSPDKLIRLATGRLRLEADIDDEAPAEPSSTALNAVVPVAPAPPQIPANIGERIGSGSLMEAAVSIYTTARRIAISRGVKVRDSDTHREFYRMAVKSYPFLADHLRPIVDTYERMRYGHLDASAADLQDSLSGLTSMQAELNRESKK